MLPELVWNVNIIAFQPEFLFYLLFQFRCDLFDLRLNIGNKMYDLDRTGMIRIKLL